MKKEVLIAIVVGFSLGLVITFGIYRAQKSIRDQRVQDVEQAEELEETEKHQLTVTQPKENEISSDEELTVSGITSKDSVVTVVSQEDEIALLTDEFGNFTAQISLTGGANTVLVTSFDGEGNMAATEFDVVFSTADLDDESEEEQESEAEE